MAKPRQVRVVFCANEHGKDIAQAITERLHDSFPDFEVVCALPPHDPGTALKKQFGDDPRVSFTNLPSDADQATLEAVVEQLSTGAQTLWQSGEKRDIIERLTWSRPQSIEPEDAIDYFVDNCKMPLSATPPEYLNIGLTNHCHYRCFFCSASKIRADVTQKCLSIEDFYSLKTAIESAGIVDLTSPGEVLLHPHAREAMSFVAEHNRNKGLMFTTTGALLSEELLAPVAARIDQVTVSLNAATEATFQRDMGSHLWDRVLDNLRGARRHLDRNRITLSFVAHAENIEELPDFVRLAAKLDVWHVRVAPFFVAKPEWVHRSLWFCKERTQEIIGKARDLGGTLGVIVSNIHESAQQMSTTLRQQCAMPTWGAYITPNGDVLACCYSSPHVMGNIHRAGSFEKIWNGKKYQALRRRLYFRQCRECPNIRKDMERLDSHIAAEILSEAHAHLPSICVKVSPIATVGHVQSAVECLKKQTYPVWQAILMLNAETDPAVVRAAQEAARANNRLRCIIIGSEASPEATRKTMPQAERGLCCTLNPERPFSAGHLEEFLKGTGSANNLQPAETNTGSHTMTPEPILFSLSHFREIILAAFDVAGVRRFVEIGSQYGMSTEQLCDYAKRVGGQLITIDPAPQDAARALIASYRDQPHFRFIEGTSLEALPALGDVDAYIIDGDHNYYTVFNELVEIEKTRGDRPWLVFEHDVCWPCGRRDMYYAPERIPAEFRHPFLYNVGVTTESSTPIPGGFGDVPGLAIAVPEGGPRNGVRTAIEDFVAQHPELKFEVIPAIFGVGIIYSRNAPWVEKLAGLLRPYTNSPLLERMEQNRVWLSLQLLHHYRVLGGAKDTPTPECPPGENVMEVFRVADKATFSNLWDGRLSKTIEGQSVLSPGGTEPFGLTGMCAVCGKVSTFTSDFMFAGPDSTGRVLPAWRERQICSCRLNCRQRSCFQILKDSLVLTASSKIYCTEQQTDLYHQIRKAFPQTTGSEFYGDRFPLGTTNSEGVRNEDITRLTFADESFDCVFSLDVMEHVPDYRGGFREMARCLKPGGRLLLTAPFHFDKDTTTVRASVNADGSITHHLPAVYHGNPIDPKGSLCFNDFGWDILEDLRQAGFGDATLFLFTAPHLGYIGLQYIFIATRSPADASARNNFRWGQPSGLPHRPAGIPIPTTVPGPTSDGAAKPPPTVNQTSPHSFAAESSETLREEADSFFLKNAWDEAAQRYKVLTGRFPNELQLWQRHVQCLKNQGFAVLADLILDEALERHPDWASALDSPDEVKPENKSAFVEGRS
jgi:MoaA/NifB/PqqE/SkfB family radical SAM enzyme/SAM-dependent methyltransferase